jgi:glycerophosphoryl diester phosphodiesterase
MPMLKPQPRPGHPYMAGAPLLIAHRGGAGLAPENTMAAFEAAVDLWGADMLEMDVHRSADGRIVVIHDPTVDRTSSGSGAVADLSWDEIREFDAGHHFVDPAGEHSFRGTGVRFSLFEEVLERFPRTRINVEAKARGATGALVELIRRHGATHRVLGAATEEEARGIHHGYEGPSSASRRQLRTAHTLLRLGLGRFHVPDTDALQLPDVWQGRRIVTPSLVAWAHERNLPLHVWTIDEEEDMHRLLTWGVDGIQTDRPDRLARILHERTGRPIPPGFRRSGETE